MLYEVNPFRVHGQENDFLSQLMVYWYIENVLVCAHFSSKQAHGTYCLCSIKQFFRLLVIVKIFSMLLPKSCSGGFK